MSELFEVEYANGRKLYHIGLAADAEANGTPVLELEPLGNGQLVPGWARLDFSAVDPGSTANVTVTRPSSNYRENQRVVAVALDGSWQYDVVYGMRMKFNPTLSFGSAWWSKLYCGSYYGSYLAGNPNGILQDWSDGLALPGQVTNQDPGSFSHLVQWKLTNRTGQLAQNAFARKVNTVIGVATNGFGLLSIISTGRGSLVSQESDNGNAPIPHIITFSGKTSGPDRINLLVNGSEIPSGVVNTSNNASGSSHQMQTNVLYNITTGALKDTEIIIHPGVENTDVYWAYVMGVLFGEITPSVSGNPVARPDDEVEDGSTWGISDVGLSQSGPREVEDGASVYIFEAQRFAVGVPYHKNPHPEGFVIQAGLALPAGY